MHDFFEDLYDDNSTNGDPSFSLADFKKWLSKQKKEKDTPIQESVEDAIKEKLKSKFKSIYKKKRKKSS